MTSEIENNPNLNTKSENQNIKSSNFDYNLILQKYPHPNRFRHHIKSNVYFPYHKNISEDSQYPALIDKLNWSDVFINGKSPSSLDIGCGMGKFLIEYAIFNPDINILGIEVRPNPVEWIKGVIKGEKIENCGVIHYTMANGLNFIENNSLDSIFYFFPDPWFKNRQSKRRVLKQDFLQICYDKLKVGGKLYIQTDVELLHKYHLEQLYSFIEKSDDKKTFSLKIFEKNESWDMMKTDQELHVIKKGFDVFRVICTKI